ncbi:MAG: hypothetical protein KDD62_05220, partial [Bdellovibrionales bacterium]|nr:hypothetical protein [Bdellovibrionales bacterium]
LKERYEFLFAHPIQLTDDMQLDQQKIFDLLRDSAKAHYAQHAEAQQTVMSAMRAKFVDGSGMQVSLAASGDKAFDFQYGTFEQDTILESLDYFWNTHLQSMDQLRDGIGLRGYGQKNPLHEYQKEGFELFSGMLDRMKEAIVRKLFYSDASELEELLAQFEAERLRREALEAQMKASHENPDVLDQGTGEDEKNAVPKDPDEQRARLEQQRKDRRKRKKRKK